MCFLATVYVTCFCCDRHDDDFDLQSFFPGPVLTGQESVAKPKKPKKPHVKRRQMQERPALETILAIWWSQSHKSDPLNAIMPASWIMDDTQITTLSAVHPSLLSSAADVTQVLGKSTDWLEKYSEQIHKIIDKYDHPTVQESSRKHKMPPRSSTPDRVEQAALPRLVIRIPACPPLMDRVNLPGPRRSQRTSTFSAFFCPMFALERHM
jgi:hypothetical protein